MCQQHPIICRLATLVAVTTLATTAGLIASRLALAAAVCTAAGLAGVAVASTIGHHRALARITALHADLRRAFTDPVTGLPVRAVAEEHLHAATGTRLTVAAVDVDDMHSVNNIHGHDFGDAYLAGQPRAASSMRTSIAALAQARSPRGVLVDHRHACTQVTVPPPTLTVTGYLRTVAAFRALGCISAGWASTGQ